MPDGAGGRGVTDEYRAAAERRERGERDPVLLRAVFAASVPALVLFAALLLASALWW